MNLHTLHLEGTGPNLTATLDGQTIQGLRGINIEVDTDGFPVATIDLALSEVTVDTQALLYLQGHIKHSDNTAEPALRCGHPGPAATINPAMGRNPVTLTTCPTCWDTADTTERRHIIAALNIDSDTRLLLRSRYAT